MRIPTAKKTRVTFVNVACPHCGEEQENTDNASLNWTADDLEEKRILTCRSCNGKFWTPRA